LKITLSNSIAALKNPYMHPEIVSLALPEVTETQKRAEISKVQKFDLEI